MSVNRDRGEVALSMGGEDFILHYDWTAVGRIRGLIGAKDFDKKLAEVGEGRDPGVLAEVVAIGLARNHPDIKAADVLKLAPPLVPTVLAFNDALMLGFYGPDPEPVEVESQDADPTPPPISSNGRKRRRSARA